MKGMDLWVAAAVLSLGWSMVWSLFSIGIVRRRGRA